jgi:hypothetical protein
LILQFFSYRIALPLRPWPLFHLFEECASFISIFVFYHLQNLMHCRCFNLERQLASSQVPKEQQSDLIKKYGEKVHMEKEFF